MVEKDRSLTNTVFFLNTLILGIPLLIAAVTLYGYLTINYVEKASAENLMYLKAVEKNIGSLRGESEKQLITLNTLFEIPYVSKDSIYDAVEKQFMTNAVFQRIEQIDTDGVVVFTYPYNLKAIGMEWIDLALLSTVTDNGQLLWHIIPNNTLANTIDMTVILKTQEGYLIGYLNAERFNQITKGFAEEKEGFSISIIDDLGAYIANDDVVKVTSREIEPHFDAIATKAGEGNNTLKLKYNHQDFLVSSIHIENSPWRVIVYREYKKVIEELKGVLVVIILLAVTFIGISAFILTLSVRKMRLAMASFMEEIENVADPQKEGHIQKNQYKEFNVIGKKFNIMAQNIQLRDRKLSRLAYNDTLTGLKNRTYLYDVIQEEFDKDHPRVFAFIINVDDFKSINDIYGHDMGDELLTAIGDRLIHLVPRTAKIIRLGSDEFLVLLHSENPRFELEQWLPKVMDEMEQPFILSGKRIQIAVSMAAALMPEDAANLKELLRALDTAMNAGREKGKRRISFYNPQLRKQFSRQIMMENAFKTALKKEEFILFYQIQVSNINHEIVGFEALIRWNSSEFGFVNPMEFIPLAEKSAFIIELGYWIIDRAMNALKVLQNNYKINYVMAINISAIQLLQDDFVHAVTQKANHLGLKPEYIELEITESIFIENPERVTLVLNSLKALGFRIALDDFGTGYSSLSYLQMLPLDVIKIDRSFIIDCENHPKKHNLLNTIIQLSHDMGCQVVAEGIETEKQYFTVKTLKADISQGYYFGKPLPMIYLEDVLKTGTL